MLTAPLGDLLPANHPVVLVGGPDNGRLEIDPVEGSDTYFEVLVDGEDVGIIQETLGYGTTMFVDQALSPGQTVTVLTAQWEHTWTVTPAVAEVPPTIESAQLFMNQFATRSVSYGADSEAFDANLEAYLLVTVAPGAARVVATHNGGYGIVEPNEASVLLTWYGTGSLPHSYGVFTQDLLTGDQDSLAAGPAPERCYRGPFDARPTTIEQWLDVPVGGCEADPPEPETDPGEQAEAENVGCTSTPRAPHPSLFDFLRRR